MTNNQAQISDAPAHDAPASDKHCVVRSGTTWFSVPAESVREITIAPELVSVPRCHSSLAGLCHLRSEFIPVLALENLLEVDGFKASREHNKLLVIRGRSPWALLIAEAAAIESLETLISPETLSEDRGPSPIIGTAMFREQVVRVLDPNTVFQMAHQALEDQWRSSMSQASAGLERSQA